MLLTQLLRAPLGSRLVRAEFDGTALTLGIATTQPSASCPLCGLSTWRVHSRYIRRLAELPVLGHPVRLLITVRRFFCPAPHCPRQIFTEPLDGFAGKHARTTVGVINAKGGRDHWGSLGPLLLVGGGLRGGQVIGLSNRDRSAPQSEPVTTRHLIGTIMHTLFDVGRLRLVANLPREFAQVVAGYGPIPGLPA